MDFRSKRVKLYSYTILYWFLFLMLPLHSAGRYRQSVNRVYGNSLSWRLIHVQMPAWRCTVILNEKCEPVSKLGLHCTVSSAANSWLRLRRVMWVGPRELCCSSSVAPCLCGGATCWGTNVNIRTFKKLWKLRFVFWISCSRDKKYSLPLFKMWAF